MRPYTDIYLPADSGECSIQGPPSPPLNPAIMLTFF